MLFMECMHGKGRRNQGLEVICLLVGIHFKGLTNHNMLGGGEVEVPNVASTCMQFEKIRERFLIPCLLMGGSLRVACSRSSKETGQLAWVSARQRIQVQLLYFLSNVSKCS